MNAVTRFNPAGALAIPDHIASFFGEESNIEDRVTVPSLSYEGKVWTVSANGDKRKLTKVNDDGDEEAVGTMRVVILDYAKRRGRAFYEGTYDPAKPGKPVCWSEDGIKPHASVEAKQHGKCEGCPMSIKGSKVNDSGKSTAACSQHRMLAIVPANKLDFTPLRLKLSITSDWDGQSPELEAQGWFAFSNFTAYLQKKGASHTAAFVTKMRFDPNVTWPKVMFAHDRWLDAKELEVIKPIVKSDEVKGLLAGTWTATGVDGEKIADSDGDRLERAEVAKAGTYTDPLTKEKVSPVTAKPPPKQAEPVAQPVETRAAASTKLMPDDDDAPLPATVQAARAVAAKSTLVETAKKVAQAPAKVATPAKAPIVAPVVAEVVDPSVEALLAAWGEDD
jgi:hypothetical protein